jgi:hypothetical protein
MVMEILWGSPQISEKRTDRKMDRQTDRQTYLSMTSWRRAAHLPRNFYDSKKSTPIVLKFYFPKLLQSNHSVGRCLTLITSDYLAEIKYHTSQTNNTVK